MLSVDLSNQESGAPCPVPALAATRNHVSRYPPCLAARLLRRLRPTNEDRVALLLTSRS